MAFFCLWLEQGIKGIQRRILRDVTTSTTWCKSALGAELDTKMHLALWSVELHLDFTLRAQMRVIPGSAHIIVHNDAVPNLIHLMTGKHNLNFLF